MIIWSGLGFLTPLIAFLCLIIVSLVSGSHTSSFAIALLLGAAINWFIGKRLNDTPGRILTDEQTKEQVVLKPRHTFFFLRMEYWSGLFALIGLLSLL